MIAAVFLVSAMPMLSGNSEAASTYEDSWEAYLPTVEIAQSGNPPVYDQAIGKAYVDLDDDVEVTMSAHIDSVSIPNPAQSDGHLKRALLRTAPTCQQTDVSIPPARYAFQASSRSPPILKTVGPILRTDPRALHCLGPGAVEFPGTGGRSR